MLQGDYAEKNGQQTVTVHKTGCTKSSEILDSLPSLLELLGGVFLLHSGSRLLIVVPSALPSNETRLALSFARVNVLCEGKRIWLPDGSPTSAPREHHHKILISLNENQPALLTHIPLYIPTQPIIDLIKLNLPETNVSRRADNFAPHSHTLSIIPLKSNPQSADDLTLLMNNLMFKISTINPNIQFRPPTTPTHPGSSQLLIPLLPLTFLLDP